MAKLATIGELPARFARLAAEFRGSAATLARSNIAGVVESPMPAPPILLLRTATVQSRFSLATEGNEVVLFVDSDTGKRLVLDASIQFRIVPAIFLNPPSRMLPEAIRHSVVAPPFLETAAKAKASGAIEPFLELARRIGQWVAGDFDQGAAIPLDVRAVAAKAPVIHKIFQRICEAWSEAYNESTTATFEPDSPIAALLPDYEVQDYQGSVVLRLKPDGSIAKDDEDDPFQLQLTMRIAVQDGFARSRVTLGPPDFLVSGDLQTAFLQALQESNAFAETASQLGVESSTGCDELRAFLESASAEALVFRVKRMADCDADVVVYSGSWSGRAATLVVRGDFHVQPENQVTYLAGTQKIVYSSLPLPQAIRPQSDLAQYCVRLLSLLENWIGVLQ